MNKEFTVTEHLEELRRRILLALAAVIISALVIMPLSSYILRFLRSPASGSIERLVYFGPEEAFLLYMRVSLIAGLIVSFPVIMFQFWAFVSPAINRNVRKHALVFVFFSSLVFILGCAFAYYVLLPMALNFLLNMGRGELEPVISATRYISFVTGFMLACGLVFEMPVLSYFLTKIGLISAASLRRKFKYAVIIIVVAAAVITPTGDAFNMILLALPMFALYEVSIWVSFFAKKGTKA
ncbi:MAG: twin-arginine translocase subunit TatC [Candidatus Omnitrophica bacterium]|nr:twin-arginine translocase subunit TatC [Candidatus Omnitrophota bacterium]